MAHFQSKFAKLQYPSIPSYKTAVLVAASLFCCFIGMQNTVKKLSQLALGFLSALELYLQQICVVVKPAK